MIEIETVDAAEPLRATEGAGFDLPGPGVVPSMSFRVAMWFRRPAGEEAGRVELSLATSPDSEPRQWDLRQVSPSARDDVPARLGETAFGFDTYVDGVDLFREFEIVVTYRGPAGACELGRVRGRRGSLGGDRPGRYRPLLVCSQGRMGGTAVMKALLAHPLCIASDRFPYEDGQAAYYAKTAADLLRTPDLRYRLDPMLNDFRFLDRTWRSQSPNRLLHSDFRSYDEIEELLAANAWPVADFARGVIDRVYSSIAARSGKSEARYFLEKSYMPRSVNELLWLYDHVKLVLLSRDTLDVFRSSKEFNAKRGFLDFQRQRCPDDATWIDTYSERISCMVDTFDHHPAEDLFLLRFEDLMANPREELARLGAFVDPGSGDATLDAMVEALGRDDAATRTHRTRTPGREVGSWRGSLESWEVDRIRSRTGEFRRRFGYAVDDSGRG